MGKKRIEEFTAEELSKVWLDDDGPRVEDGMQAVIDYIKANLDTGSREPMGVDEIAGRLWELEDESSENLGLDGKTEKTFSNLHWLAEKLQPLTVQQGFVPDWSKAPDFAKTVKWFWAHDDEGENIIATRPAPKMRPKTDEELLENLVEAYFKADGKAGLAEHDTRLADAWAKVAREMVTGQTVQDLCRAVGIPLETIDE